MNEQTLKLKDRLISIDALRGLAMFLILAIDIGGAPIFQTFTKLWGENFANAASEQFSYGFTKGLRLCFIAYLVCLPAYLYIMYYALSGSKIRT
jgi:predicted hydrocarbon binding protein